MTRRKMAALAFVVAAAATMSALLLYIGSINDGIPPVDPPNDVGPISPPVDQRVFLNVISSPSSFPLVDRWVAQYNIGNNIGTVQLVYSNDADDANIAVRYSNVSHFLSDHSADILITGKVPHLVGNFTYASSVFLPVSPQAVAIVYNVPGFPDLPSGLRLDAPTLHAILSGNATHWNDPRIVELNGGLNLPNEPIVVVHERRVGSASEMLQRYLASSSDITWSESSLTADSPDVLSAIVRQTPFSIGYVDFSHAMQTRMTYAALANSDGEYILPSIESIGRSIQNGTIVKDMALEDELEMVSAPSRPSTAQMPQIPPMTSIGQLGNGSYPIVGFYYVAFGYEQARLGGEDPAKTAASLDFAKWISGTAGQRLLADVHYPSIYEHNEILQALADSLAADLTRVHRFEQATNFTNNPHDSVYGQVAAAGDNVYIVWQESVSGTNYDIFLDRSHDRGNTFENSLINLSMNPGFSEHPQIAASGDSVYIVWADNTAGNKEVLFTKSTDNGRSFDEATALSDPTASSYNQEIASSGNHVYVVWQEQKEGNNSIIFRASTDGGDTFSDPVTIEENAHNYSFPKVAANENVIHVIWSNPDGPSLHYIKSTDGGSTFSPVVLVNDGKEVGEAQLATYNEDVYVMWGGLHSHTVSQLLYVISRDEGTTFTDPVGIDSDVLINPMNVEVAIMPGRDTGEQFIHVLAEVTVSPGNDEIMYISSADGSTFTEAVNLSNTAGVSECPSIAVSGFDIFVVWEDRTAGHNEIFFVKGSNMLSSDSL